MSTSHLDLFDEVDVIQVGARNMQNFEMLKELGHIDKPILLKRGLASTIEEFLMSAEYIMSGGNEKVILCERGIRTFETFTRNTVDIGAVPVLKRMSHLPVIVDPSHATGLPWMVEPIAKAAIAAGADGVMIAVHGNPSAALSDGAQSTPPISSTRSCGTCAKSRLRGTRDLTERSEEDARDNSRAERPISDSPRARRTCPCGRYHPRAARPARVAVVSDSNVAPLTYHTLRRSLEKNALPHRSFTFPAGESSKTLATIVGIYAIWWNRDSPAPT
jgi:hypothetical protein